MKLHHSCLLIPEAVFYTLESCYIAKPTQLRRYAIDPI
jgi:hypothetical protein